MTADPRIPVLRGTAELLQPGDAVLVPSDAPAPPGHPVARLPAASGHVTGCACCLRRGATGQALGRLFLARARGEVGFFARVVAVLPEAGWAEVEAAVAGDVVAGARYRLEGA